MSTEEDKETTKEITVVEQENEGDTIGDNDTKTSKKIETRLRISRIACITDTDFENVDLALHGVILIFNELINGEDTSQWYFLEKMHENYFETKEKWIQYLQKISPNKPIDFHDIRKQIINGYYNKKHEKTLLNDIGSVFTNAMIRYNNEDDDDEDDVDEDDDDDEMYDEAQCLLTKFQTLCSEMEKEREEVKEKEDEEEEGEEDDEDGDILIPRSDDVFEIEDYYCASPWERLISEIEKQLQAWNLYNGNEECAVEYRQQMKNNCILSTNIRINSSTYNYILEYHDYTEYIEGLKNKGRDSYTLSMNEMIARERDPTQIQIHNTHEICSWFGISRFILLLPGNSNIDYIDESDCMFMFSTLCIAMFNIQCSLSYFIPFGDQWDMSFRGGLKYNRYSINYICKSQRSIPPLCEYLDGIFKVFKRHLRLYYDESDAMLQMSTCSNNPLYRIYGLVSYKYVYDPSTNILALLNHNWRDFIADDKISYGIRWGPTYSPLKSLSLQTIWTYFPEGAFIDNIAHTDLDPYNAPKWIINAVWDELSNKDLESQRNTPLTKSLYHLLIIARDLVEDCDIVWRDIISSNAIKQQDMKQVMIEKRMSTNEIKQDDEINPKLMSPADSNHPLFEDFINQNVLKNDLYIDDIDDIDNNDEKMNECHDFIKLKQYKSPYPPISQPKCVPFGSLMSIFVLRLFEIEDIDIGHIGDVWYKFTYEVSKKWTDCKLLPGIYGLPDFRTCLLHQKLQLLQECIRRKLQHQAFIKGNIDNNNDENNNILPQGIEKTHPYLYLLSDPNIAINIPITQDHPIFTADKLEAHYEELVSLGSSMDASKKRAELQSKQLKSDMMAFKAANPKCQLEDFIRWYSPNDWIVDTDHDIPDIMNQDIMNQDINIMTTNNDDISAEIVYFDSDDDGNKKYHDVIKDDDDEEEEEEEGLSYSDDIISTDSDQDNELNLNKKKREKKKKRVKKTGIKKKQENKKKTGLKKQEKGHLSSRMRAKDNIWSRIWNESESVPAMEQELLFDFDIEGNEALKWIMNLQPTDTLLQICQIGIGNIISILKRTPGVDQQLIPLKDMIQSLIKSTKKIWKLNKNSNENYLDLENAIKGWSKELRLSEMGCACGAALTFKFNTKFCKDMMEKLMIQPYCSQIMSIKEKEAVLSIIGHRIYDDMDELNASYDSNDDDNNNNNNNNNEDGKNFNFWNWGSPKENNKDNKNKDNDNDNNNNNNDCDDIKRRKYELPKPSSKQYNVIASAPRPHPDSQATPNRMHVTIDQYGFKMALATSTIE